jgi:hypothetical protein
MTNTRHAFIDWMKFLGILVIVYGHAGAASIDGLTPPVLAKQLGVAFFLFVMGFSLAREQRTSRKALFNRLFEVFLFGIGFALFMSVATYAWDSRLALSNYLPFLLGANVLFNNFPANPTTWYIGTYIHVLLIWALLLRGRRIRGWVLIVTAAGEILVRAALAQAAGLHIAYMAFSNWATVFLLGIYYGQQNDEEPRTGLAPFLLGLCLLLVAWPLAWSSWPRENSFPFMRFLIGAPLANLLVTSAAVTVVYLLNTWLVFQVTRRLQAGGAVRFFANNTLIVFIAHMPLYYALVPLTTGQVPSSWGRVGIWFAACFVVLMGLSEAIQRAVRPKHLREQVWLLLTGSTPQKPQAGFREPTNDLPAAEAPALESVRA